MGSEMCIRDRIKVVQRVPLRIALDATELKQHPLLIGLSMTATVDFK